jgi:hypothetical protein
MKHKISFPQGTSPEDMADQIDEMIAKAQAAKVARDAAEKAEKAAPTIVFDRACSVDQMFDALKEQSRQYHEEAGTPMPPPHPSDLIPHPNPVAPPYVGETAPEPKKKRKKKI